MPYKPTHEIPCNLCGKRAIARQLCRLHYNQARAAGTLSIHRKLGPEDVFDSRYRVMPSGCWEWTGGRHSYGYGVFMLPGSDKHVRAHRYSYERTYGPIPDGLVVMHKCDNPPCVNPDHLQLGTKRDNIWDAVIKGRTKTGNRHWTIAGVRDSQGRISRKSRKHI